jgi:hypothetical protein
MKLVYLQVKFILGRVCEQVAHAVHEADQRSCHLRLSKRLRYIRMRMSRD